jgi:hypothetical protein
MKSQSMTINVCEFESRTWGGVIDTTIYYKACR